MKKIQTIVVAALTVLLVLTCWSMNKRETEKIKIGETEEGPRIVVGTLATGKPYSDISDDGVWSGFEADVWAEIEERSGMVVELKQADDEDALFEQLKSGEIDTAANCFNITQKRLEEFVASGPLYADVCVVTVGKDSKYQTFQDLRRCTVGVTEGQVPGKVLETLAGEFEWNVKTYEDEEAGLQDYKDGKIDAYAGRLVQIEALGKTLKMDLHILENPLYGSNVGWLFNSTENGKKLRDEMNVYLADMLKDGTLSQITEKWFGEDMTKFISEKWIMETR